MQLVGQSARKPVRALSPKRRVSQALENHRKSGSRPRIEPTRQATQRPEDLRSHLAKPALRGRLSRER